MPDDEKFFVFPSVAVMRSVGFASPLCLHRALHACDSPGQFLLFNRLEK
jgi:hypothetical protein